MAAGDVEVVGPLGGTVAQVRFTGPFQGRSVQWELTLGTLGWWQTQGPSYPPRAFIHVLEVSNDRGRVACGLPMVRVDLPVVLMAVRMLRQWKRLDLGCHRFGPEYDLARNVQGRLLPRAP